MTQISRAVGGGTYYGKYSVSVYDDVSYVVSAGAGSFSARAGAGGSTSVAVHASGSGLDKPFSYCWATCDGYATCSVSFDDTP
jgi:hypothetical protein